MMSPLFQFIRKKELELPEVCTTNDLIKAGIFKSHQAARAARKKNKGPAFFQMERTVFYPKLAVIEFLKQSAHPT